MTNYTLPISSLKEIHKPQLDEFLASINSVKSKIEIPYNFRGYTVNDKRDEIRDSKINAIGFFSGAGGLDIGAQLAGSKVISSLDFDEDSVRTMKQNDYFIDSSHLHRNIEDIKGSDYSKILKDKNPEKLILLGGPPCQPFSKAGYWVTHKNRLGGEDPRNMIGQYLRLIDEIKPDGFLLENVESLLHPKNKLEVAKLSEAIEKLGYNFIIYKANSIDFGVPQKRKRVFFIASKKKLTNIPIKTHGSAEEIASNNLLLPYERVIDWIAPYDDVKYLEREESTLGKTYDRQLKQIPPGMNYFALTERENHPNPQFEANKRFWSFLLKLHPTLPSWTIAAQPGPWVGPLHWNNRRLRVPEIAAIQTFPSDYTFYGSRRSVQKQIGNAVPSLLGKAMVEFLINSI